MRPLVPLAQRGWHLVEGRHRAQLAEPCVKIHQRPADQLLAGTDLYKGRLFATISTFGGCPDGREVGLIAVGVPCEDRVSNPIPRRPRCPPPDRR